MKAEVPDIALGSFSDLINRSCYQQKVNPKIMLTRKAKELFFQPTNFLEQLNEKNVQIITQYRTCVPDMITELRLPCFRGVPTDLLDVFAQVLSQSRHIQQIHVNQGQIEDEHFKILINALMNNTILEEIEIFASGLSDKQLVVLCELVQKQPQLTSLKLSDNNLTERSMEYLSKALKKGLTEGQRLKVLHLGGNPISAEGLQQIINMLIQIKSITSLGLRNLGLSKPVALQPVKQLLSDQQILLTDLQLRKNDLSQSYTLLCEGLRMNKSLRVLEIQDCAIGREQIQAIAATFQENIQNGIHALNLSNNPLGPGVAKEIFELLSSCKTLTTLTLNNCDLDSQFVISLSMYLRGCGQPLPISGIGLAKNKIDDQCGEQLAYFIGTGQLTSLDVSQNQLTGMFIQHIYAQTQTSVRLRHLDISGNRLGTTGGNALAQLLRANHSIIRLYITDCSIPQQSFDLIAAALAENTSLQQMQYGGQSRAQNICNRVTRALIDERLRANQARADSAPQLSVNVCSSRKVKSDEQFNPFNSAIFSSQNQLASNDFNEMCHRVFSMGDFEQQNQFNFNNVTFESPAGPDQVFSHQFLFEDDFIPDTGIGGEDGSKAGYNINEGAYTATIQPTVQRAKYQYKFSDNRE